jgi:hypothetical protein
MQVFEKTLVFALLAVLLVLSLPNLAFAQEEGEDSEGTEEDTTTVVGSVFAEARENTTMGYQDVERTEVIAEDGTIANPGGAGNENINLATDDDIATPPTTNLQEVVNPQTIETQNYGNMEVALRGAGYAMAEMQETLDANGVSTIIVKGLEGVMQQPNEMELNRAGALYGYYVDWNEPIDGAWVTVFKSVTGSPQ